MFVHGFDIDKLDLEGIDWKVALAIQLYYYQENPKYQELRKSARKKYIKGKTSYFYKRLISSSVDYEVEDLTDGKDAEYLFFTSFTSGRKDYDELFNSVIASCAHPKIVLRPKPEVKTKNRRRKQLYKKHVSRIEAISGTDPVGAIEMYTNAIAMLDQLEKVKEFSFKKLVVFADMQVQDNVLVQHFSKSIPTITLQHGLYIEYPEKDDINFVNYSSVKSKYFLAWGKETLRLINKHHPECHVQVCGHPDVQALEWNPEGIFFSMIMDGEEGRDNNILLLRIVHEICKKTGKKVSIKFHPRNDPESYEIDHSILIEGKIENADFVIGSNTSLIYKLMRVGIPSFKFRTNTPSNVINEKLEFNSVEELMIKFENQDINFKEEGKFYIQDIAEDSLSRFCEFFDSLVAQ